MAKAIKKIKIKKEDGSYTSYIPIGVDAKNVDMSNGKELEETTGFINVDSDGNIAEQLNNLDINKINSYKTISSMKEDLKIKSKTLVKTLGRKQVNDGGSAFYEITSIKDSEKEQEKLDNNLYATLINNIDNNYYDEVAYTKERYYNTDCYFITIPKYDSNENLIIPFIDKSGGSPLLYAQNNFTTFTCNGSCYIHKTVGSGSGVPTIIHNGEVIRNYPMLGEGVADNYLYIGITADRNIKEYKVNSTTNEMLLNDGCVEVFDIYYKIIENGLALDLSHVVTNESTVVGNPNPRLVIGINANEDILFFACDGRTDHDIGLTSAEMQELLISKGWIQAWNMDGGGSTNITLKGSKLNRNIDENGTADRNIGFALSVKKQTVNKGLAKAFSKIGEEKQNLIQQLIPIINQTGCQSLNNIDLNTLTSFTFGFGNRLENGPLTTTNGYVITIPHTMAEWKGKYCTQILMLRDSYQMYQRRMINEVWTDWFSIYNKSAIVGRSIVAFTKTNDDIEFPTWSTSTSATDTGNFDRDADDPTVYTYANPLDNTAHKTLRGDLFYNISIEVPQEVYGNNNSIDIYIGTTKKGASDTNWPTLNYNNFTCKLTLLKGQTYAHAVIPYLVNCAIGDSFKLPIKAPAGVIFKGSLTGTLTDTTI